MIGKKIQQLSKTITNTNSTTPNASLPSPSSTATTTTALYQKLRRRYDERTNDLHSWMRRLPPVTGMNITTSALSSSPTTTNNNNNNTINRNTQQQQQPLLPFNYFSLDETMNPITCIHALDNVNTSDQSSPSSPSSPYQQQYLYVGCTHGKLLLYKIKAPRSSSTTTSTTTSPPSSSTTSTDDDDDGGIGSGSRDDELEFESFHITIHLQQQQQQQQQSSSQSQQHMLGSVLFIESDVRMGLVFVVFEGKHAPLHIFNLDMTRLLYVSRNFLYNIQSFALDRHPEQYRFAFYGCALLPSLSNTTSNTSTTTTANANNNTVSDHHHHPCQLHIVSYGNLLSLLEKQKSSSRADDDDEFTTCPLKLIRTVNHPSISPFMPSSLASSSLVSSSTSTVTSLLSAPLISSSAAVSSTVSTVSSTLASTTSSLLLTSSSSSSSASSNSNSNNNGSNANNSSTTGPTTSTASGNTTTASTTTTTGHTSSSSSASTLNTSTNVNTNTTATATNTTDTIHAITHIHAYGSYLIVYQQNASRYLMFHLLNDNNNNTLDSRGNNMNGSNHRGDIGSGSALSNKNNDTNNNNSSGSKRKFSSLHHTNLLLHHYYRRPSDIFSNGNNNNSNKKQVSPSLSSMVDDSYPHLSSPTSVVLIEKRESNVTVFTRPKHGHLPRIIHLFGDTCMVKTGDCQWSPMYMRSDHLGLQIDYYSTTTRYPSSSSSSSSSSSNNINGGVRPGRSDIIDMGHSMMRNHATLDREFFKLGTINFSSEPKDIALCFPYIAGIVHNQIEVFSLYTGAKVSPPLGDSSSSNINNHHHNRVADQKNNNSDIDDQVMDDASWSHLSQMMSVISFDDGKLICGSSERFYLVTGNSLAYMIPPPLHRQLHYFYDQSMHIEAHHLSLMKTPVWKVSADQFDRFIANMHYEAAYALMIRGDFQTAFQYLYVVHMEYAELSRDIRDVLSLFRRVPALSGSSYEVLIDSDFFSNWRSASSSGFSGRKLLFDLLEASIANQSINASSFVRTDDEVDEQGNSTISDDDLAIYLLSECFNHLIFFLERIRSFAKLKSWYEQAALEYTLIALYIRMMDLDDHAIVAYHKIESIITGHNNCCFDSNLMSKFLHLLKHAKCLRHYSLLIKSSAKGELNQYLRALTSLLQNFKDDRFAAKYDVVDDVISILCDVNGDDLMSEDVRPSLVWCMTKNPSKSSKIFTVESRSVQPDPTSVLRFLDDFPQNIKLQYLHYLINHSKTTEPKHHTLHALTLIDNIMAIIPPLSQSSALRVRAGEEFGLLGHYRQTLLNHLRSSNFYDVQEVCTKLIQTERLFEELVEVYRKRLMHAEALSVLLYDLDDWIGAELYCDIEQEKQKERLEQEWAVRKKLRTAVVKSQNIPYFNPLFTTLVQVCINDCRSHRSKLGVDRTIPTELINLLNRRFVEMDVARIVSILPDETPLSTLELFLSQTIQNNYHQSRVNQMKNRLAQNANIQARKVHIEATMRNVCIKSDTICPVCRNPIGNAVFAVFPDLSSVHYRCLSSDTESKEKLKSLHPHTRLDFQNMPFRFDCE